MNQLAKRQIYFAHIHSHLVYANTVWSNYTTGKQKKTIEKIKKYCIRAISKKKNKIQNTHPIQVTKNHEVQGNKKTRTMQTSIQDKKEIIT